MRSGRCIAPIEGHLDKILSMSWSSNGYILATAGGDHSIRIHDLRQLRTNVYTIPAHTNLIRRIKFHDTDSILRIPKRTIEPLQHAYRGTILTSCSYDGTLKIWGSEDWKLIKSISCGPEGEKVMDLSMTSGNRKKLNMQQD